MKNFAYPKLCAAMVENGISRKGFALDMGMSYTALTRRLLGEREITVTEAKRMCDILGKSFDELFC